MTDILLTAFRNTSSEKLIGQIVNKKTVILPNDKEKDSEVVNNIVAPLSA